MSTYNKKISGVIFLFILISFVFGALFVKDSFAGRGHDDECEPESKYVYASHDSTNSEANFDFKNNDNEVVITIDPSYQVTEVWLDVKDDNYNGYKLYGTTTGSYNPNPGTKIESAKVKVIKVCPTARPTATPTTRPTCSPSNDPTATPTMSATPTPTATSTQSADPTVTPCVECQQEPTPTPISTVTPEATPIDVCPNLEGVQTSIPNEYHHDNDGINCLKFELGGPSSSSSSQSQSQTGQVLGASTMAETGTVAENIYYSLFSIGSMLTSLGIMKNAKAKK